MKLPSIEAKAPASEPSIVSVTSGTTSKAQGQSDDAKYIPKRTFNSMKHTRQSSYLSKVMLKKKGSIPSATATEISENASESRSSDQTGTGQPSSRFIEKIKHLQPGSTFGQSSAHETCENHSQATTRDLNDYINASIKAPRTSMVNPAKNAEDGARTVPARSSVVDHRKSFSVACASQLPASKVSFAAAAYGEIEQKPTNHEAGLETPQAELAEEKDLNVFKQTSTFEIETPCFKGPMRTNTNGSTMYANFPRQPLIEYPSSFIDDELLSPQNSHKAQSHQVGEHLATRVEESIETDDTSVHQQLFQASRGQAHTSSNASHLSAFAKHTARVANGGNSYECILESSASDHNLAVSNMQAVQLNDFDTKSATNQMSERKHPSGKKITFARDATVSGQASNFQQCLFKQHQSTSNLASRLSMLDDN